MKNSTHLKLTHPPAESVSQRHRRLIEDALQIEAEEARTSGALGYMARTLAQATLPHADPKLPPGTLYSRDTGKLTLTVAPTTKKHGVPYGTIPRVILAWICTEAVYKNERVLSLGRSQAEFLSKLRMHNNGSDIRRFRDQALRLFKSVISVEYADDSSGDLTARLMISDTSHVFWHPTQQDQPALWESSLELSERFFQEIRHAPVPINLDAFHALSRSPLAMDIYTWLPYRMFVLRKSGRPSARVPWAGIKAQFGANYDDSEKGLYNFKAKFRARLREVLEWYPEARDHIEESKDCLILTPAKLHIPPRLK